jgi:hypothetical protein
MIAIILLVAVLFVEGHLYMPSWYLCSAESDCMIVANVQWIVCTYPNYRTSCTLTINLIKCMLADITYNKHTCV